MASGLHHCSPPYSALPFKYGLCRSGKESSANLLENCVVWSCPFPTTVLWESKMLFLPSSLSIMKVHVFIFSTISYTVGDTFSFTSCASSFINEIQTVVKGTEKI